MSEGGDSSPKFPGMSEVSAIPVRSASAEICTTPVLFNNSSVPQQVPVTSQTAPVGRKETTDVPNSVKEFSASSQKNEGGQVSSFPFAPSASAKISIQSAPIQLPVSDFSGGQGVPPGFTGMTSGMGSNNFQTNEGEGKESVSGPFHAALAAQFPEGQRNANGFQEMERVGVGMGEMGDRPYLPTEREGNTAVSVLPQAALATQSQSEQRLHSAPSAYDAYMHATPTMELPLGSGESRNDVHVGLSQPRPQQSLSVQEQRDLSGFPQGIRFGGGILQQAVNQFSRVSSAV